MSPVLFCLALVVDETLVNPTNRDDPETLCVVLVVDLDVVPADSANNNTGERCILLVLDRDVHHAMQHNASHTIARFLDGDDTRLMRLMVQRPDKPNQARSGLASHWWSGTVSLFVCVVFNFLEDKGGETNSQRGV